MQAKLEKIQKLLGITEQHFVSWTADEWTKAITNKQTDEPQALSQTDVELLNGFTNQASREKLLVDSVLAASAPLPAPDAEPPAMKLRGLLRFLDVKNPAEFLTMSEENWMKKVNDKMLNFPRPGANDNNKQKEWDELQELLDNLKTIDARKKFFVNSNPKYDHLLQATAGTEANAARQNERDPRTVIAPQGYDSPSLYTVMGDKPKDRDKNIKAILKAHEEFMGEHYDNLPQTEKDKYGPREAFLETFKGKKTYFKDLEALEKSTAWDGFSDATKELYKAQKGDFPMNIIILPVEKQENVTQLMDKIKDHIKPMPPPAKKEVEKAEAEKPGATPLPGAETSPSTTGPPRLGG